MTWAEANKIIKMRMRSMLAQGEPLDCLLDDYIHVELITEHPSIAFFLPRDEATIYNNYVVVIDQECSHELKSFIKKLPGLIT